MPMILEGILTTENPDGSMHVAPLGPHVSPDLQVWKLKPFQSSTSFANLYRSNRAVFHVVDDGWLLVQAVLGIGNASPARWDEHFGYILQEATHWYALTIQHWDLSQPRADASATMVESAQLRPFFGWNRSKHALVEACILYSRKHLLETDLLEAEIQRLQVLIDKTAGPRDQSAWQLLLEHFHRD